MTPARAALLESVAEYRDHHAFPSADVGQGGDFRDSGWSRRGDEEFMAREVAITALDGHKWVVLETFPLRGEGERRS